MRIHRSSRVVPVLLLAGLASLLWPAGAEAHPRGRGRVFVGYGGFYNPYWGGFGWAPYRWGHPWGPYPPYYGYAWDTSGDIRIQAEPRDAQVYVDGYFVGNVDDFDGFAQRLRLQPGEYEIELFLPGYKRVSEKMLIRPRTSYKLRYTLEPLAPGEPEPAQPSPIPGRTRGAAGPGAGPGAAPPYSYDPQRSTRRERPAEGFGRLNVQVQPIDALVVVDGQRWHSTPDGRVSIELRPGTYEVRIEREGRSPYVRWVEIEPGETEALNVSLSDAGRR